MSDTIISVEGLSKRYLVGHRTDGGKYVALRDVLVREARNFTRKAIDVVRGRQVVQGDTVEEFWALRNVSFEVARGEVIGIIGRNGAGKSTLLKILSRITEPTEGRVLLGGRTSSLLEVGTGFHPELTGRENIFLNGAILGMTRNEVRKKFDEIVTFAEVENFLDVPVKHYSSGMYVRLAFAVAAHLEPEILIVDEVLAVGDASFQEKSLGKIKDAATGGRTVLFVSHNMAAVLQLTKRAIVLSKGAVEFIGTPAEAVETYMQRSLKIVSEYDVRDAGRFFPGTGEVRIVSLRFDRTYAQFKHGESIQYRVRVECKRAVDRFRVGMTVFAAGGSPVGTAFSPEVDRLATGEEREVSVSLPSVNLGPGSYFCTVTVGRGSPTTAFVDYDIVPNVLFFEVSPQETPAGTIALWYPQWGPVAFPDLTIGPISD
jgi:lipopolysaccharide transport system ATP-binding protein